MDRDCSNCPTVNEIEKRLIVVETEQKNMKTDITEIKDDLKANKAFLMATLVTSLLSLLGIIIPYAMG